MAILSKIKSAVKKTASNLKAGLGVVGGAVKSAVSSVGKALSNKQTAAVFQIPIGQGLTDKQKIEANKAVSKYTGGTVGGNNYSVPSGLTYSVPNNPSQPTSVKGSAISSPNVGYRPSSNHDSPSHSPDLAGASNFNATSSTPTNFKISSANQGAGTTTTVMPSAPSTPNYQGEVVGGNVSVGADPNTGLITTPTVTNGVEPEAEETASQKRFNDMVEKLKAPPSQEKAYERAQRESGLEAAQQQRNNTQNEINAVTTKMNTDLLQLRGTAAKEGVVEAVYGGQQAQITREATIKLLPLQAQLAADQDNLDMAENKLNRLFDIYYTDRKNSVDFYNKNVEAVWELSTEQEKKQYERKIEEKKSKQKRIDDIQDFQQQMMMQALRDGNAGLLQALGNVRPPVNINAKDIDEATDNYYADLTRQAARYGTSAGSGTGTTKKETPIFTQTQINKGSNNAGLNQETFQTLAPEVQNYYVNLTATGKKEFNSDLALVKNGELSAEEMKDGIDSSGAADSLKEYLKDRVDEVTPEKTEDPSFFSKAFQGIVNLFQ